MFNKLSTPHLPAPRTLALRWFSNSPSGRSQILPKGAGHAPLNIVFFTALTLVVLIMFGILPREFAFIIVILYLGFVLAKPVHMGVNLFLRSIPIFIALPITENFDNFNTWRLVLLVIFLKWIWEFKLWNEIFRFKLPRTLKDFWKKYSIEIFGIFFFVFATTSLLVAPDVAAGIKRIIFILNAVFLFIILNSLIKRNPEFLWGFAKNFAYSGILAVAFGYLQFVSAYLTQAWEFHYWWGQVVSLGLYGHNWANIATNFGNTWFSYSGDTLRLRMFSTFPDSHSFPMYVIMTLPALVLLFVRKYNIKILNFKVLVTRYSLLVTGLALIMLALILSGTRGIWLAILGALLIVPVFKLFKVPKKFVVVVLSLSLLFISMFPIYFTVVSFPQFQDTDFEASASFARIRSLIDLGETSNQGRIEIWRTTVQFIQKSPVLGIGIGNYPIILREPQSASLAGASAHNIYLDILSTTGIFGLVAFLGFLFEILRRGIVYIKNNSNKLEAYYVAIMLFSLFWISAYLMTDSALYDGRAMLAFMAMAGMGAGLYKNPAVTGLGD